MKTIPPLLAVFSGLSFASESPAPETPPKGLAASDWSSIRAAYEAGRHAAHRQENGTLSARNPGQQWRTEFDGKGFTVTPDHGQWTWGLELTAYGQRTLLSASSSLTHDGGKITCQRDEDLTEWFINDTRGLEQGWTIHSRERGTGVSPVSPNLTLTLAVHGDLQPEVSPDSSSVSFQTESGGTALTYGGLKAWDADGKNLLVRFEPAGENAIRIAVEDQNARYPITIDPIAQQAYLKASNAGAVDYFGSSVAVSGDTVVVGANGESSNATGVNGDQTNNSAFFRGAAYVFTRSGTTWTQQAYLKPSTTGDDHAFGYSVAVSGDTVVVGAANEGATNSGAAYVFTRSGTSWSQQAYLKASNPGVDDYFGTVVAVSGNTMVVGAWSEDSSTTGVNSTPNEGATNSGAAYVFTRSGTTWSQQAYLKASNTQVGDYFGWSVGVSGDTVVVGAMNEDSSRGGVNSTPNEGAVNSGAAYVFTRSGTTWSQQAYLKASYPGEIHYFGYSVAVSGDTMVAGARNEGFGTGAAYVFTRSGTTWSEQAYLKASNMQAGDNFGWSVGVSGDTVVVGAISEDSSTSGVNSSPDEGASSSGAAYVFTRSVTTWSQQAYLKASNTGANNAFGVSVSVSGDTVVIGANRESESANESGAAYVFDLNAVGALSDIAVQQAGTEIATSTTKAFGSLVVGSVSDLVFSISNTGAGDLTLTGTPKVAVSGSSDFTVTVQPASPVTGPSGSTNFTVRFTPTGSGLKTAALSIPNNDGDENPFVINLTGTATIPLSTNADMGSLSVTEGTGISGPMLELVPPFSPTITSYHVVVPQDSTGVRLTGLAADPSASISAMGNTGTFGSLNVSYGLFGLGNPPPYSFIVRAQDGFSFKVYTVNFLRSATSEIAIAQAGSDIFTGTTKTLGSVIVGTTSDLMFTISNLGAGDLTLTGTPKVAVSGSPDFTVTAQPASPITGPSGSSNFTVRFTPTGSGLKSATLSIPNNDDDENPFVIHLTGTSTTAIEAFNETIAADSGLTGNDALPSATPFNDGVENVLKYAFNMNLAGPDTQTIIPGTGTAGLPAVTVAGEGAAAMLQVEFIRRKNSGLTYTPMISPSLLPGSFVPIIIAPPNVTSIDGEWERVVVETPANPANFPRSFVMVEVKLPN